MSTSTYDGVFLAPESIVSDPSAFAFLTNGGDGVAGTNDSSRGRFRPDVFGRVQFKFRFLAERVLASLR